MLTLALFYHQAWFNLGEQPNFCLAIALFKKLLYLVTLQINQAYYVCGVYYIF